MALATSGTPHVDIELSIDPSSHSFAQQSPPSIALTLTSRANHLITIATWGSPLDVKSSLTNNGFIITDMMTEEVVPTSQIMVQRRALKRIKGTADEKYFLTLRPNVKVVLSTGFGRGGGSVKPQPKAIAERGWELDEYGREMKTRRSVNATGVDGLEPGHRYLVGLNLQALKSCRWAPVSKDEVLVDQTGEGSYLQDYPWETMPLDFSVTEVVLRVLE